VEAVGNGRYDYLSYSMKSCVTVRTSPMSLLLNTIPPLQKEQYMPVILLKYRGGLNIHRIYRNLSAEF